MLSRVRRCRSLLQGHTTWAQFWGNVAYLPVALYAFRGAVPSPLLRAALWPLNIWALELVEGCAIYIPPVGPPIRLR